MRINPLIIPLIKKHEGFRSKPYKCTSGKWTIAYGRNLEDNGVSEQEGDIMLHTDVQTAIKDLASLDLTIPDKVRDAALCDMMFNLGLPTFSQFKNMIKAIREEDWERAAEEALDSRWATQVGDRAITIADMLRKGE